MKCKSMLKASLIIVLMLVLLLSTTQFAFADTANNTWATKASISIAKSQLQTVVLNGKVYEMGGQGTDNQTYSNVEEYDPVANTWTPKASMLTQRVRFKAEVIGGKIYVFGGVFMTKLTGGYTSTPLSSVEVYDPETNKWIKKASMPTARERFAIQYIEGKIYVLGGQNSTSDLSSVEEYDPVSDTWTKKASMPTPKSSFEAITTNGKIYAIGGQNSTGALSSVEEYDISSDKWETKTPMSTPRAEFKPAQIGGKIYAIGGRSGNVMLNTVEQYDPIKDTWAKKSTMTSPRCCYQLEAINNSLYCIGGISAVGGYYLSSSEVYNPTSDTWTPISSMAKARESFETEVLDGKIYAIGGSNSTVLNSVEEYTASNLLEPTLSLTASSHKVKVGQQFTTVVAIHNVTNICAEDIKITYDKDLFAYAGAEAQTGLKIYKEDTSVPGTVRLISACEGKENAATGDKGLITLKFTAKKEGTGKVDIIKGRIADNSTLEMDVAEANCGEDTITVEGYGDVNRNGEFTLLDLGIDGWYNGMSAADTDTSKFNADVIADGKIDDNDLAEITKGILTNTNYQPNNL